MIKYIKVRSIIISLVFLSFQSCNESENKIPERIERVLQIAGSNQSNLREVIQHYSTSPADSMKLKATYFLIENMEGLLYYDGELLKQYQQYFKLIRRDKDHGEYFMQSFKRLYGPFSYDLVEKKYDINEITSKELIDNIDTSFKVWGEQPWGKNISFNQFCEYILPYRIGDESPAYNRHEIYENFNPLLDSIRSAKGDDVISAAIAINNSLKKSPQWLFSLRSSFLPHYPASSIIKYKAGSCREMTDLAFYAMRSVGIPVAIDFVPQWPYRNLGHEFNSLLNKDGKMILFLGAEDNPGTPHKPLTKKGKVYRHMYSINPASLGALKGKAEIVPFLLEDPRLKDVTDEYVQCFNVEIKLNIPKENISSPNYAYIAVFNNKSWIPIDWGIVKNNVVHFKKMEGDIVYLAGYYEKDSLISACNPFVLTKQGKIEFLSPDSAILNNTMVIDRIVPITPDSYNTWNISGGYFQGANRADFSDAEILCSIPVKPNPFWNDFSIDMSKKFRYVRFLKVGTTNIGELEFYSGGKKLQGNSFGTKPGWFQDRIYNKAFDNNIFTCFDAAGVGTDSTWLGLDFGSRKHVDKIRLSPPVDDELKNKIQEDHHYQLMLWRDGKWFVANRAEGKDGKVTFKNVPSGCLYLLKDADDKTIEGRIFTYHDKPEWF